ncbi:hypothetical protein CL619_03675 [archaeon]|nr:hypothetical protein [archaeon]|tara:strand:+ start:98 stop:1285 length:1188 start_codon:yes stop_codon:yes gene_type:complete
MAKFVKIIVFSLVLLILGAQFVFSIGLQGQSLRVETVYVPGTTKTYSYSIGAPPYEGGMTVFSEGDLADWLHTSVDFIESGSGDYSFSVDFIMTEDPLPPSGKQTGKICVQESPPDSGAMVVALTKSCAIFEARVLYDGIYPVISMSIEEGTEQVDFSVTIRNDGKSDVSESSGTIEIIDIVDDTVLETVTLSSESYAIASAASIIMSGSLDITDYTPGTYSANAKVLADGETFESTKNFSVGSEEVSVSDYTNSIELSGIQKFTVNVKNEWAEPQAVSVSLSLGSEKVDAQEQTLEAWEESDFVLYLDTSSFDIGEQTSKLTFSFGDGFSSEESVTVTFIEGTGDPEDSAEESEESSGSNIWIIIGGGGLLVLVLVGLVLFIKSRSDEDDEEDF